MTSLARYRPRLRRKAANYQLGLRIDHKPTCPLVPQRLSYWLCRIMGRRHAYFPKVEHLKSNPVKAETLHKESYENLSS